MVAKQKNVLLSIIVLLLAVFACQGPPPAPTSLNNDLALTLTSLNQTLSALTASLPAGVASATLTSQAIPSATGIPATIATSAPPILTATFTVIPSPSVPMVSVTVATNC